VGVSIKDIVHERAWVRHNAFAVGVRILAETRNRKHSRELFKILRETYEDVTVHGFYESPQDYVSGKLNSEKFEKVEEETPFEGEMNIQYNQDIEGDIPDIDEEDEDEDVDSADSATFSLQPDSPQKASVDDLRKLLSRADINKLIVQEKKARSNSISGMNRN